MAILMSATILSGTGAVAASAYTESDIVETSTTIRSADDASVTEFTFDKKTGELTLEKCCDADFEYGNGEPGDNVPWNNFRDEIKTVSFSKEIESIPDGCFRECVNLKKVTVPENVKSIGRMAFYECESLDHIELPSKLESIGAYAFDYTAYYSHSRNWDEIGKGLYIGNYLISVVSTVSNFKARDDTTLIAGLAFRHTDLLEAVSLPESLKYISEYAFAGRYRLTSVNIPASVKTIGKGAFEQCSALENVTLNEGLENIDERAFGECKNLTEIKLPSTVKYIGEYAFEQCPKVRSISFGEGIEEIGDLAFTNCGSLTEINFPSTLKKIGFYSFCGCRSLSEVTVPEDAEEISSGAFSYCSGLKEITIPESVTAIDKDAFKGCVEGFTIKGYKDTAAHKYADENNIKFFDLDAQEEMTDCDKPNTMTVKAKAKAIKAKSLRAKNQKVKLFTVKNAQGKVEYKLLAVSKKLKGKVSVNKKGVFTFKKGKYKKGVFKLKVKIRAYGNEEYLPLSVKKVVKVKIK